MSISSRLTQLAGIKADIKQALTDKGASPTDDFTTYAGLIDDISTGDTVTISGSDVPSGQTVLIGFDSSGNPYISQNYHPYIYTGISNGDTTFRTALPDPLPYLQNYTINGSVSIDSNFNGTGWSASNYLSGIIEPMQEVNLEILGKAYFSSGTSVRVICPYAAISSRGLFTYFDSNTSWDRAGAQRNMNASTWYWFKVRVINGIAIGWTIADNNYTEETLPDIDSWTGQFVTNKNTEDLAVTIGKVFGSNGTAWGDKISISSFKIYTLDIENSTKNLSWQMYAPFSVTASDITKYIPSGEWEVKSGVGTPVDTPHPLGFTNGLTDFSRTDTNLYASAKTFRWNLSNATSIYCKGHFKSPTWDSTANQHILTTTTTNAPILIYRTISGGNLTGTFGTIIPNPASNTEYWFEATMDNQGNVVTKYSTDGENWTTNTDIVTPPTWQDYTDIPCIGCCGNNYPFKGSIIDLECGYTDTETHSFKLWK